MDLSECDKEPIHIIGRTQSFAALVEFSRSARLLTYSENCPDHFGTAWGDPDRCRGDELFPAETWRLICSAADRIPDPDQVERIYRLEGVLPDRLADLYISLSPRGIIVEVEEAAASITSDIIPQIRHVTDNLNPRSGVEALALSGAEYVRELTGFDRVMIYMFHADGSGEVIAESLSEGTESFMGLRYPASDIPQQARALYQRNLVRLIADVDAETCELLPVAGANSNDPLDLSMCISRAVSPIHIQYLKNMGVRASMSISIMGMDGLWGLIACHSIAEPLHITHPARSAVELFGQMLSYKIGESRALQHREITSRAALVHSQITARFAGTKNIASRFDEIGELITSVIPCDAIIAKIDGQVLRHGDASDELTSGAILNFMKYRDQTEVFATDRLGEHIADASDLTEFAAGILVIPISRLPEDYLILCRKEITKKVRWAGNPDKPVVIAKGKERLEPRQSFAEWKESVRGQSQEWTAQEIALAESLRATFVEVLFLLTEQNALEKERANKKQQLLINELNHRVRNIITLIASLVEQSSEHKDTIAHYKAALEGRIAALSSAHNLMTSKNVSATSLKALIESEMAPYQSMNPGTGRWIFQGPDIMITLDVLPILALVIHELVTNAVKHGALRNDDGRIDTTVTLMPDGGFRLDWVETGGPPLPTVNTPGTGTTLIEEAVPFQLSGQVDIRPRTTGMEVTMTLPKKTVSSVEQPQPDEGGDLRDGPGSPAAGERHFLVLEDEFIIAMTEKKMLLALGADRVTMASNCADALAACKSDAVCFAVLDINLKTETSALAADWLLKEGVPFVFASGYGSEPMLDSKFADVPRITKPFTRAALEEVIPPQFLAER